MSNKSKNKNELPPDLDGYDVLFKDLGVCEEQFLKMCDSSIIIGDVQKGKKLWKNLKNRIDHPADDNEAVYVRHIRRNGSKTNGLLSIYEEVFKNVKFLPDKNNNEGPKKVIEFLTGLSKKPNSDQKRIANYQISHVFGKTKNPFAFCAPWNIIYLPKFFDPFTGHEASHRLSEPIQARIKAKIYSQYSNEILEFDDLCRKYRHLLIDHVENYANLSKEEFKDFFKASIEEEFKEIDLSFCENRFFVKIA